VGAARGRTAGSGTNREVARGEVASSGHWRSSAGERITASASSPAGWIPLASGGGRVSRIFASFSFRRWVLLIRQRGGVRW